MKGRSEISRMMEVLNVEMRIIDVMNGEAELIHRFHDIMEWHKLTTINPSEL